MFARLLATVSVLLLFGSAAFAQVIALQSRGGSHIGNNSPRAIVVADLNNDGKPDFATAGYGINGVTVYHGTGESGFHISAEAIPTGAGPFAMTSADVNSDGRLDLIVANADADTVTVLVNDPSDPAGFRRAFDWAVPGSPRGVAAGDFDRDGDIDLAATSTLNNQVYVAKGSDDGLFEGIGSLPVSPQPHEIVQFDYDHDGIVDLATICASGVVAILTGDGTGLFTYTAAIGVGNNPLNLAVGDLDRNGWQDIVVANTGEDTVTTVFFLGGGSVHVPAPKQRFGGDQPRGIAVSDLNGDGTLDLIVANRGSDNVTVARGTGNRSAPWADAQNLTTSNMDGARAVAIGDFDTDGRPDVFVGSQYSKTVAIFLNQSAWRGRQ